MTLFLERARSRNPVTWLTLLGVLLLPAAVGGILVAALNDPTQRLDSMTAAIVNLDEPVTIDDQPTPLGRQLASGLVEGSDDFDSNLSWIISNEDDAAEGLADGTYQAIITIPEDFSAAATSGGQAIADGGGDAEQAQITVTTPPDGRLADDLITNQIASVAAATMGSALTEATLDNVLVGFTTIGDQIGEAASGAVQLATGAQDAAAGAAAIPGGATQLSDGAAELGSGALQLAGGLDTIASRSREAAAGAGQLGAGLNGGADALLAQGIVPAELTQGAAGVSGGLAGLTQNCAAAGGSEEFCNQLAQVAAASTGVSQGISAVATQAPATIAEQLRDAGTAATQLGSGLGQLAAGVDQSAAGARSLNAGAGQLSAGAGELATGATGLSAGLDSLAAGTGDLADGLQTAASSLPSFSDEESTSLSSVVADPVTTNAGAGTLFGPTAIPLLAAIVLWFGGLASFIALRAVTERVLTSRRSSATLALRSLLPAAALGAGQGLLVALIVQFVAKYDAAAWWGFAGMAVLAGVAFAAVNQALVAVFGGFGRWVAALIGVLAVATGLISTVPDWLAGIGAALPTAPAISGLIEASGSAATGLIVWAALSLAATTLVVALRRTTTRSALLATA